MVRATFVMLDQKLSGQCGYGLADKVSTLIDG
jgi:hypothetical protein